MTIRDQETQSELTDEEYDKYLNDPASIPTVHICTMLREELDRSIAHIKVQHVMHNTKLLRENRPPTEEEMRWFGKSQFALAMRGREYHRVFQQYKAMRGQKNWSALSNGDFRNYNHALVSILKEKVSEQVFNECVALARDQIDEQKKRRKQVFNECVATEEEAQE